MYEYYSFTKMIQIISIYVLFLATIVLGEEHISSSASSNNLRGIEKMSTTEDMSVEGIIYGALAPLLVMKANIPSMFPAAMLQRFTI